MSDKPVKNIIIKKSEANINFERLEKTTTRAHTMTLILLRKLYVIKQDLRQGSHNPGCV